MKRAKVAAGCLAAVSTAALGTSSALAAKADSVKPPSFDHVSCTGAANEVEVVISKVSRSVGLMIADLYRNDKEHFLSREGRVDQVRFAARAPETRFCLHAPAPGQYAIAVYHDENANKTLDRRALGMPAEPYGISNNPRIRFGPPSIEESLFDVVESGAQVHIKLKK